MRLQVTDSKFQIAIAGAGPAGTALAIRLARANFSVVLIEREKFPRQKLCGEFISPECLAHFKDLGVLDEMLAAGGKRISETVFYSQEGNSVAVPSAWLDENLQGALSLSRAEMDFRLLEKAKNAGVKVLENANAVGLLFEKQSVTGLKIRNENGEICEVFANLTIDATGRANVLGKFAERETSRLKQKTKQREQKTKLVGFKAHLRNANAIKNKCEIYFFRGGYGGLSPVENDLANFCFLIKADLVKEFGGNADEIIERVVFQNKRAFSTLQNAEAVHDWLAVSVDNFGLKNLNPARNLLSIGDAGAFIDPFTGSGMLMALESAEILAQSILAYNSASEQIAKNYTILHRRRFQKRLRVCAVLRRLAFAPRLASAAVSILSFGKKPREILARATRRRSVTISER